MTLRFMRHYVTDGHLKARVHYALDNRADRRKCVTLYAKSYQEPLGELLADAYKNDTDFQTDYFDKGRAVIFESHPCYAAARARAEQLRAEHPATV